MTTRILNDSGKLFIELRRELCKNSSVQSLLSESTLVCFRHVRHRRRREFCMEYIFQVFKRNLKTLFKLTFVFIVKAFYTLPRI